MSDQIDYVLIPLTQGLFAKVSPHRAESILRRNWHVIWCPRNKSYYAVSQDCIGGGKTRSVLMHREILGLKYRDGKLSDHINHDTLDNRDCNLRVATVAENARNSRLQARNTSGFKGVYFQPKTRSNRHWKAQLSFNNKTVNIGSFETPEEAHAAYCSFAYDFHGDFVGPTRKFAKEE